MEIIPRVKERPEDYSRDANYAYARSTMQISDVPVLRDV